MVSHLNASPQLTRRAQRSQALPNASAQASTTLESRIFAGEFGAVVLFEGLGQAFPSLYHALHGTPIRKVEPFPHP